MTILPDIPSFRLDGRRALVSGAGRGIGLGCAYALAHAGAHVTLAARSEGEIKAASEAIADQGLKATYQVLDVSDLEAVRAVFKAAVPFDILVNNAGTNRPKPMQDVSEDDFDAVMNLNVKSAFFVAQSFAQNLITHKKSGSMIHIGSQMGHVGGINRSLYCASKWGMEGMNKAFALDLAGHGIRSNTIAPTFIETPLTKPFFEDEDFLKSVLSKIKIGRLGQVSDLLGAVVFLAGDASALMTGTSMIIDGGWTAD
ncbi:MAG: 3-oxoacyl-ACP reductase [Robiginitomaculum sp.]|nr:MAG: 3-oxoacyl-ACP reductase [Robiginitomaculum sp.]